MGFQSIAWTFVRHTISRCLTFCRSFPQFLPSGKYGFMCFGYFFLRSAPSTFPSKTLTFKTFVHTGEVSQGLTIVQGTTEVLMYCMVYVDKLRYLINHLVYCNAWFAHLNKLTHVGSPQFLPSGQYGLCFGYCFSGPLPPCSHHGQVTLRGACFRESLVIRLYSEIGQIHLSIEAQCGTAYLPLCDCHN